MVSKYVLGSGVGLESGRIRRLRSVDFPHLRKIMKVGGVFTESDVKELYNMIREYFKEPEGDELITYVYKVKDEVAGFVTFGRDLGDKTYEIHVVSVDPRYQGMGIGKKLVEFAEGEIKRLGGRMIFISTSSKRDYIPARKLYKGKGYMQSARIKDCFSDGEDKIIYSKRLRRLDCAS